MPEGNTNVDASFAHSIAAGAMTGILSTIYNGVGGSFVLKDVAISAGVMTASSLASDALLKATKPDHLEGVAEFIDLGSRPLTTAIVYCIGKRVVANDNGYFLNFLMAMSVDMTADILFLVAMIAG